MLTVQCSETRPNAKQQNLETNMLNKELLIDIILFSTQVLDKEIIGSDNLPNGFTFRHAIERTNYSLLGINRLSDSDDCNYCHSINLICRNILTDYILLKYIKLKYKNDEDSISIFLLAIYNDEIIRAKNYISNLSSHPFSAKNSKEDFHKQFTDPQNILSHINQLIELNKSNLPKNITTTTTIFKEILSTSNSNSQNIKIIDAYDIWLKLSKNEHIGWFSFEFSRNLNKEYVTKLINRTICYSIELIEICLEYLAEYESVEKLKQIQINNNCL